jgi:hypothetical protein
MEMKVKSIAKKTWDQHFFLVQNFAKMQILFLGCDLYKDHFCKNGEKSEGFELALPNLKGCSYRLLNIFLKLFYKFYCHLMLNLS